MKDIVWKSAQGNAVTDTWAVAQAFGKRNANLVKSVKTMAESVTFAGRDDLFYMVRRFVKSIGRDVNVYVLSENGFKIVMRSCRDKNPEIMKQFDDAFKMVKGESESATNVENIAENNENVNYNDENVHEITDSVIKTAENVQSSNKIVDDAQQAIDEMFDAIRKAIRTNHNVMAARLRERDERIDELERRIDALVEMQTMAEPVQHQNVQVQTTGDAISMNQLSKMMSSYGIKIGEIRLYEWMRENNYCCAFGNDYNLPTQQSMEMGLFIIEPGSFTKPNGQVVKTRTTRVTEKGQIYFINKFLYNQQALNK